MHVCLLVRDPAEPFTCSRVLKYCTCSVARLKRDCLNLPLRLQWSNGFNSKNHGQKQEQKQLTKAKTKTRTRTKTRAKTTDKSKNKNKNKNKNNWQKQKQKQLTKTKTTTKVALQFWNVTPFSYCSLPNTIFSVSSLLVSLFPRPVCYPMRRQSGCTTQTAKRTMRTLTAMKWMHTFHRMSWRDLKLTILVSPLTQTCPLSRVWDESLNEMTVRATRIFQWRQFEKHQLQMELLS